MTDFDRLERALGIVLGCLCAACCLAMIFAALRLQIGWSILFAALAWGANEAGAELDTPRW